MYRGVLGYPELEEENPLKKTIQVECKNCKKHVYLERGDLRGELNTGKNAEYMHFKCPFCGDIVYCFKGGFSNDYRALYTLRDISESSENLELVETVGKGLYYKGFIMQFTRDVNSYTESISLWDLIYGTRFEIISDINVRGEAEMALKDRVILMNKAINSINKKIEEYNKELVESGE